MTRSGTSTLTAGVHDSRMPPVTTIGLDGAIALRGSRRVKEGIGADDVDTLDGAHSAMVMDSS